MILYLKISPFVAYTQEILLVAPVFCSAICMMFTLLHTRRCYDAAEKRLRTLVAAYLLVSGIFWLLLLLFAPPFGPTTTKFSRTIFSFFVWGLPIIAFTGRYLSLVRNFGDGRSAGLRGGRAASLDVGYDPELECRRCLSILISMASALLLSGVVLSLVGGSMLWIVVNATTMAIWQIVLVYHVIERQGRLDMKIKRDRKSASDALSEGEGRITREMLDDYFRANRPYTDPRFVLADLAGAMGVNRSEMSGFINASYGVNFKRFVNRWRLGEFERLMSLPANERKNPYRIQQLAGFSDSRHYLRALQAESENDIQSGRYIINMEVENREAAGDETLSSCNGSLNDNAPESVQKNTTSSQKPFRRSPNSTVGDSRQSAPKLKTADPQTSAPKSEAANLKPRTTGPKTSTSKPSKPAKPATPVKPATKSSTPSTPSTPATPATPKKQQNQDPDNQPQ
jgi:AraC-like DNA-binding protein